MTQQEYDSFKEALDNAFIENGHAMFVSIDSGSNINVRITSNEGSICFALSYLSREKLNVNKILYLAHAISCLEKNASNKKDNSYTDKLMQRIGNYKDLDDLLDKAIVELKQIEEDFKQWDDE